ncbi:MAG: MBL fold metallo-hydrolase [Patescibacteria group bacterium]|nr:MBL fold metallo-hydrolase [Patescibacteria group bacterium]
MYLSWLGLNCFKIQTKDSVIITDPFQDQTGLKMPRLQAELVLVTEPENSQFNNIQRLSGEPFIITGPGEYEIKQIFIRGLADQLNGQPLQPGFKTLYFFEIEKIAFGHLGAIDHLLTDTQLEIFEDVDVLLVPIGGNPSLTAEKAAEVISQIEPRIVIPMYYKTPGLKVNLQPLQKFLTVMGIKTPEESSRLKLTRNELPQDETRTIILKP